MSLLGFNIIRHPIIPEQEMGPRVYVGFEAAEIVAQGIEQRIPITTDRGDSTGHIPAGEDDVPFDMFIADLSAEEDRLVFAVRGLEKFGFVQTNTFGKLARTPLCESIVIAPVEPGSAQATVTVRNAQKFNQFHQASCVTGANLLTGFLRPKLKALQQPIA